MTARQALREGRQFREATKAANVSMPSQVQIDVMKAWLEARAITGCSSAQYMKELVAQNHHSELVSHTQTVSVRDAVLFELMVRHEQGLDLSDRDEPYLREFATRSVHAYLPGELFRTLQLPPKGDLRERAAAKANGGQITFNLYGTGILMDASASYGRTPTPSTIWLAKHNLAKNQRDARRPVWYPAHISATNDAPRRAGGTSRVWTTCGHRACTLG